MLSMRHAAAAAAMLSVLMPAIAGAAPSGVVQVWSGFTAFGKAKIDNAMDASIREPGRAAGVSRNAVFLHPKDTGDATATYTVTLPAVGPGDRLILSAWCSISDGAKFDDPLRPSDGAGFAIRVDGKELFHQLLRESKWVPYAFDLAPWAGRQVEIALVTDCGGKGNANYDWAQFGEPQVLLLHGNALDADGKATGTAGAVLLEYSDAAPQAALRLMPDGAGPGLSAPLTGSGIVCREFGAAEMGEAQALRVQVTGATMKDLRVCLYQPHLVIDALGTESAVSFADKPLKFGATIRNDGKASLLPLHTASASLTGAAPQALGRLDPGQKTRVVWELPPQFRRSLDVTAIVRWSVDGEPAQVESKASASLLPAAPALPAEAPARAELRKLDGGAYLLQNRCLRLAFLPGEYTDMRGQTKPQAYRGPVLCYARVGSDWRLVAAMPPVWDFARVGSSDAVSGEFPVAETKANGRIGLQLGRIDPKARARVQPVISFTLGDSDKRVEIASQVYTKTDADLVKLSGPKVLVGDGSTGRTKRMALFPGLEYLEGDEESSSTLDFAPVLANRTVPHPYKVTIPLMAVETPDALVALLWDQTQKWDGVDSMPSAAFASPNFIDGQANHLMQLFLPPVPDYTDENKLTPAKPYPMKAGQTVTLRQQLVIDPGAKVLDAIDHWIAAYGGLPKPSAEPRDLAAELALSRYGFMHTVWDEKTNKSRHCVDWTPANAPGVADLLLFDARVSGNAEARQRAELIARQTIEQQGSEGLLSPANCHILNGELPFHYGYLPETYAAMREQAYGAMGGQGNDGSWLYYPPKDGEALGKPGTPTVGTCVRPAWILLRYARYTGDTHALAAGLKGLKYVDAHFRAPRGAEGWECPIHAPDILACAYAVGAYVEAYRATDDKRWLEEARYWARTGLPFLYLWDDAATRPTHAGPGMRYASIPVFGTTFFTHSWLGLPVQWCGLVYAYHLQHLALYDKSFDWSRVAAGITISGMYQQFGDEKPELKGCYPDSWRLYTNVRNAPFINPEDIILNRLVMAGYDPDPGTAILPVGGERIHLTTGARVEKAEVQGDRATVRLSYFPGEASFGFVANVAEPKSVKLNGAALSATADLQSVKDGYLYDRDQAALFFKITHAKQPAILEVAGLAHALPLPHQGLSSWDFSAGLQGWHPGNACELRATPDKTVVLKVTGFDPYIISGPANIDAAQHGTVTIKARAKAGQAIGLYWITDASPVWGEDKRSAAPLIADGQWHDFVIDVSKAPGWKDTVTAVRVDLYPAEVPVGSELELQSLTVK